MSSFVVLGLISSVVC